MKSINVDFNNYFKKVYKKNQIYLHHTVSPNRRLLNRNGSKSDINYWKSQNNYVNTFCIIDSDGVVYKLYDPKYWAYHLGTKDQSLNKYSIGIELDNLGPLTYTKKGFTSYAYPGVYYINPKYVLDYGNPGYRGHRFYEAYSEEQLISLRSLLQNLTNEFNIPKHYNEDMWYISQDALNHVPGIYSHTSVRKDKSDVHPQPELIDLLKNLKPKTKLPPRAKPIVFTEKDKQIKELGNSLSNLGWNKNIYND